MLRYENLSEDWLIVRVCASFAGEVWSASDPSLEATDLPRLADWFDDVAAGTAVHAEMDFVEPNLRFELLDSNAETHTVQVAVDGELLPTDRFTNDDGELSATFRLSGADLRQAAGVLRAEALRFPPR